MSRCGAWRPRGGVAHAPGEACLISRTHLDDGWAEAEETAAAVLEQCLFGGSSLGRPAGTSGVAWRASGADIPDQRTREVGQTEVSMDRGSVDDPALRIEIQQDGTMAVVPAGSVDGSDLDSLLASAQN
ncbi:hypothetical protein NDU88_007892 [Pleurodeles waltl]|uniref:Uncharacterized protein n=1 Tax=Pleurodeles waltl TaxID=8319 RepID=A0AAV7VTL8_PLEWA|nr:hypothetical protein NDU88_007892 [Pleurodeles waltl]